MSASSQQKDFSLAEWEVKDPGNTAAIPNDISGVLKIALGSGAETNTLARPIRVGQLLTFCVGTDGGGSRAITVTGGYSEDGSSTVITLGEQGAFVTLYSIAGSDTTFVWRVIAFENVTGPTYYFGIVDLNGRADALILDADKDTTISSPTDDQIDFEVGGADVLALTATTHTYAATCFPVLPITDTNATVEGSLWYDASEDKLKFKTAAGVETITSA